MSTKNKFKSEEAILLVGAFLLLIAFILFHYEKILEINNEIKNEIQFNIYQEQTKIDDSIRTRNDGVFKKGWKNW